ncbi:iron chelate uptake ABC transporter family permease subunit [Microbacterium sp. KUDC0406]|uniref:FecCD family ABC transporter permease n=1 Tax=Microbacterium sp. KUDC0406 TaxID=2909588 RepID=UPI001F2E74B4|nr:iron chelate uptake ABC transporter family permease subunit [Microbacterium sp. KUDC0406]UJP10909.1 iron chelate uptake ABC transporter family permease subunit [Microbacterium sp. KUDC0406]
MSSVPIAPPRVQPRPPALHLRRAAGLCVLLVALAFAVLLSLAAGANPLPLDDVWQGLVHPDGGEASIVVWDKRMPRTLLGIAVGAALGVAGALIQALTRNPLADPGILGVNAGAGFAVTLGVGLFGLTGISGYVWFSFLGAAAATVLVYVIGSMGRSTAPVTMVLAGVALGAVLRGISTVLTLMDPETFRAVHNWGAGSIARAGIDETLSVLPFLVTGLVLALVLSGPLNGIALGDDLAVALGTRVVRTRILGVIAVTLLAGGATALTGGIAFIGLMVPHAVRWFVGPDQRWIIACTAIAAPVLLLVSDVVGRVVARPGEIEVGIVTAVVGAPVLIALVRRRKASGL